MNMFERKPKPKITPEITETEQLEKLGAIVVAARLGGGNEPPIQEAEKKRLPTPEEIKKAAHFKREIEAVRQSGGI